jgi:uroporphyrinogen III methyltransferase/synthase
VPSKYQAEGILERLDPSEIRGRHILIPRAAKAREILPETLRQWGAIVDVVQAYKTVLPEDSQFALHELSEKQIDVITFTSSSTVENFMGLLEGEDLKRISQGIIFACLYRTHHRADCHGFQSAGGYHLRGIYHPWSSRCDC